MNSRILIFCLLCTASALSLAETGIKHDRTSFVIGNIEFVLLHELAHAIIDDKNVPQLAPNEVIADYIAINMAISGGRDEATTTFLNQALLDSATSFSLSWELGNNQETPIPYWGAHALGIQRYYAMLCLLYGSAPVEHKPLSEFIPRSRRERCPQEYREAAEGYQWLLNSFKSEPATSQEEISYEYGPVKSLAQDKVMREIIELGIIENTVTAVDRTFGLARPLKIKMHHCGYLDARWKPTSRELIICYELLDAFAHFFAHQQVKEEDS